jgi:Uma2 family endonuclease
MGQSVLFREAPFREKQPRRVSIETFLRKYRKGAPGVKYEYNKGIIEKTEAMRFEDHYIILNLQKAFKKTIAFTNDALLTSEMEVWTSEEQWRKPDISFVTPEQTRAAMDGFEPVPNFLIEVISPNDKITEVKSKVKEYFSAGVKIIWLIFPHLESVEIYRPDSTQIESCSGEMICSAEPVVEGFRLKRSDIFKKP